MALVLYVYLPGSWNGEESCLTVSLVPRLTTEVSNGMHIVLYQLFYDVICVGLQVNKILIYISQAPLVRSLTAFMSESAIGLSESWLGWYWRT